MIKRNAIHIVSVLLLVLWGGVMLYFYQSGRLQHYLPPDGIFRPMVLVAGIGLMILALFNLITMNSKEAACCEEGAGEGGKDGCCGHDHHDHNHHHGHNHDHAHKAAHQGHDHGHDHSHSHSHGCCGGHGHDHSHDHNHSKATPLPAEVSKDGHSCCGGDHGHHHHDHSHAHGHHHHDHGHDHDHEGHAHGILEESGPIGRLVAIFLLAVPVCYAAVNTPDRFSAHAVTNKGLYNQNYGKGGLAEQYSLKKDMGNRPAPAVADAASPGAADTPPGPQPSAGRPGDVMPPVNPQELDRQANSTGTESKSYGNFTLADLEAQVPRSKDGHFMLEVPEIFYTAGDKEVQSVLNGQSVETIAQVMPEKVNNDAGTRVRIFRLQVQCCAADARPYSIPVEFGQTPPPFKEMGWVKITGKVTYRQEGNQTVPMIEASSMVDTAEPDSKMVY